MSDSLTANYSWTKPEVGGSPDTWGTKLNANFDALDTQMKFVSDAVATAQTTATSAQVIAGNALAATAYTAVDVLNKIRTVDGSNSDLNADLLDDQHGSYYLNSSNQNAGTVPIARIPASVLRNGYNSALVTVSANTPTGGSDGDIWMRV